MPAERVVELATLGGARCLGLEHEIGSLEVGKRADVIMLDRRAPELTPLIDVANALVYATDGRNVDHVSVDGRQLLRDGEALTVDAGALFAEAAAIAPKLISRAGLAARPRGPML